LPAASLAVKVRLEVEPDAIVDDETETVDTAKEKLPGVTVSCGSTEVIALPPIVPVIEVAVPDTFPVKVAVYVPLLLSVTLLNEPVEEPPLRPKVTVSPPAVRLLPAESLD
jgi:hypothetical protein